MEFLVGGTYIPGFHHSLVFHHTCGILSGLKLNIAGEIASKDLRSGIFHYPSSGSHYSAHFEWKGMVKFSIMCILLIMDCHTFVQVGYMTHSCIWTGPPEDQAM